jgi:hypothetical protein
MHFIIKQHVLDNNHRHLRKVEGLMVCTACLVCLISTVSDHSKKEEKGKNVLPVVGT